MPSGIPKPVTAAQIALYGHSAALLREACAARGWNATRLAKEIGLKGDGASYKWLAAKAAPGKKFRLKVAKTLGIDPNQLIPRRHGEPVPVAAASPGYLVPRKASADVLTFNVDSDGEARLRLDVKLPLEKGTALLRIVLDAGVLMSAPEEAPA